MKIAIEYFVELHILKMLRFSYQLYYFVFSELAFLSYQLYLFDVRI